MAATAAAVAAQQVWLPAPAWRLVIMPLSWWSGAGSNRRPSAFQRIPLVAACGWMWP